ncbi:hypothetical protein OIU74_028863 [Salix koriyanagi]|uniref:Uncharacterized protein n=1 Tax=Salix koriyanagi TaxID=2511006 RepID=A0A9Q0VCI4_9ROSI|nr:hypothetical protein OIU74_028863 [Salix koriyanagi]
MGLQPPNPVFTLSSSSLGHPFPPWSLLLSSRSVAPLCPLQRLTQSPSCQLSSPTVGGQLLNADDLPSLPFWWRASTSSHSLPSPPSYPLDSTGQHHQVSGHQLSSTESKHSHSQHP